MELKWTSEALSDLVRLLDSGRASLFNLFGQAPGIQVAFDA